MKKLIEDLGDRIDETKGMASAVREMARVISQADEAKREFANGNIRYAAMAMSDVLVSMARVYGELEDTDGRFKGVRQDVRSVVAKLIKFDKELPKAVGEGKLFMTRGM